MFVLKLIAGVVYSVTLFALLLLVPAGTVDWWRAWVFLGVQLIGTAWMLLALLPGSKDLLKERFKPPIQKGQPLSDRIILPLFMGTFMGMVLFIPLDVFRFHLLPEPGAVVSGLGLALVTVAWWIEGVALKENRFAVLVVRHQEERRQTVVDTGLYGVVRHPMYSGFLPLAVGIPLWLQSYAAALLAAVPVGIIVLRALIEEQFLSRELNGYGVYMQKVRYRLIPFLW
jgi:protein-S-isoprenylcysteine O-methyltransferase Ste14